MPARSKIKNLRFFSARHGYFASALALLGLGLGWASAARLQPSHPILAGVLLLLGFYAGWIAFYFFRIGRAVKQAVWQNRIKKYWQQHPTRHAEFALLQKDFPSYAIWLKQIPPPDVEHLGPEAMVWSRDLLLPEEVYRILQQTHPRLARKLRCYQAFSHTLLGWWIFFPGMQTLLEKGLITIYKNRLKPLRVFPHLQAYVWGCTMADSFILRFLQRSPAMPEQAGFKLAELWLGAHTKNPAMIKLMGLPLQLDRLMQNAGEALLGRGRISMGLLFKILDAAEPLSFQLHERSQNEAKDESWMLWLDRAKMVPGQVRTLAEWYIGLRPGPPASPDLSQIRKQYAETLCQGKEPEVKAFHNKYLLRWEKNQVAFYINDQKQPEAVKQRFGLDLGWLMAYIPAATPHALYTGIAFELQQMADKTLRLYDHGRNDPGRPLQIEEAMGKIDLQLREPWDYLVEPKKQTEVTVTLLQKPFYAADLISLRAQPGSNAASTVALQGSYHLLIVIQGEGELWFSKPKHKPDRRINLFQGDMILVPAGLSNYGLRTKHELKIFKAYEPSR